MFIMGKTGRVTTLDGLVREGFSDELTFEQEYIKIFVSL